MKVAIAAPAMINKIIEINGRALNQAMAIVISDKGRAMKKATIPVPIAIISPMKGMIEPITESGLRTNFRPMNIIRNPRKRNIQVRIVLAESAP